MTRAKGARGSAPNPAGATPLRPEHKTVLIRKTMGTRAPSRWSGPGLSRRCVRKTLAQIDSGGLEQIQILSAANMAGFEVITYGRF